VFDKFKFFLFFFLETVINEMNIEKKTTGQILCFIGPPGVGKTEFALSISEALQRKFTKISCAKEENVKDIVGSERYKVNLITQALINTKVMNPVILLDEIDKVPPSKIA